MLLNYVELSFSVEISWWNFGRVKFGICLIYKRNVALSCIVFLNIESLYLQLTITYVFCFNHKKYFLLHEMHVLPIRQLKRRAWPLRLYISDIYPNNWSDNSVFIVNLQLIPRQYRAIFSLWIRHINSYSWIRILCTCIVNFFPRLNSVMVS